MGCDIHAFFEVKIKGEWYCYDQPDIGRDYALFELMAGVRGDPYKAITPPKGLPKDMSVVVKMEAMRWVEDSHSASWLSRAELKELQKRLQETVPEWLYFLCDHKDIRLVFWFDS